MPLCKRLLLCLGLPALLCVAARSARSESWTFETDYARFVVNDKGLVSSIADRHSGKEYLAPGRPSPLLALHEPGKDILPTGAVYSPPGRLLTLRYPNGATATVKVAAKGKYFRFQLLDLDRRGAVDNVVWGPFHTTISRIIGDLIGVVREDNWAIGLGCD